MDRAAQWPPGPHGPLPTPLSGPHAVGWFGKLPSVGDFVARRLPSSFVQPWDQWLQAGLAGSRSRLGERWEELYLTFPVWRFVVPAGLLGPSGWAGVLMPSTDRVGRCFPLTLVAPIEAADLGAIGVGEIEPWLAGLEVVGLAGLDGEHIEGFDLRVRGLAPFGPGVQGPDATLAGIVDADQVGHWPLADGMPTALSRLGGRWLLSHLGRRILWWLPGGEQSGGTIRLDGWPLAAQAFDALILQD